MKSLDPNKLHAVSSVSNIEKPKNSKYSQEENTDDFGDTASTSTSVSI